MGEGEKLLEHAQFVRAVARHLVADPDAADDLAQDVWTRALAHPPRHASSLRSWLSTIASHLAFRRARSESARERREIAAARPEIAPPALDLVAREDALRAVADAVLALDEPYRAVVLLRFYDGLPPREVARRLSLPVETVRTRQKRAFAQLRARLDSRYGGDRAAWAVLVAWAGSDAAADAAPLAGAPSTGPRARLSTVVVGCGIVAVAVVVGWRFFEGGGGEPPRPAPPDRVATGSLAPGVDGEARVAPREADGATGSAAASLTRDESGTSGAAAPPSTGTVVARITWEEDGSPAASIRGEVTGESRMFILGQEMNLVSDSDGVLRSPPLAPGEYTVYLDRTEIRTRVRVDAASAAHVAIALPRGVGVEGSVVDAAGAGVDGAEIVYVRRFLSGDAGVVVGVADASGRFSVRALPDGGLVGARKPGLAPSLLTPISATARTLPLRLELGAPGGGVVGTVRAPDGEPIAFARVLLATEGVPGRRVMPDGRFFQEAPSPRLAADASGAFLCLSMSPGRRVAIVSARGFAEWKGTLDVPPGEPVLLDVTMSRGGAIAGTVFGLDGHPAAGAEVVAADLLPHWGETRRTTASDESGAFRFENVRAGEIALFAAKEKGGGSVSASVRVLDGGEAAWDAYLSKGLVIAGVVTDESGAPLSGYRIEAVAPFLEGVSQPGDAANYRSGAASATSDEAGRFELTELAPRPYRVDAHAERSRVRRPAASVAGVSPGDAEIAIRVPESAKPSASIRGTVVDADGKAVAKARAYAEYGVGMDSRMMVETDALGAFRLEPLPPGTYGLAVELPAPSGVARIGDVAIAAAESRDVGAIAIGPPGTFVARLAFGADGGDARALGIQLLVNGTPVRCPITVEGDTARSGPLVPGDYELFVASGTASPAVGATIVPITIEPGRATVREVALRPGIGTLFVITPPDDAPDWMRLLELEIREFPGGRPVARAVSRRLRAGASRTSVALAPGEYEIAVESDAGFRGATRFTVPAEAPPEPGSVEVRLR